MTRPFLTLAVTPVLMRLFNHSAWRGRTLSARRMLLVLARCAGGALVGLIRAYQLLLSPLLPPACRFYPTCSEYAAQAIQQHGPYGLWLALLRLLKCHPFHPGGYDPPPRNTHRPHPQSAAPALGEPDRQHLTA